MLVGFADHRRRLAPASRPSKRDAEARRFFFGVLMKLDASDIQELTPVIREVVRAVLDELGQSNGQSGGQSERLGYTEHELAQNLGIPYPTLRDARLQGRLSVQPTRIGRKLIYSRESLRQLLNSPNGVSGS